MILRAALLALALGVHLTASPARACQCPGDETVLDRYVAASAVFAGVVTSRHDPNEAEPAWCGCDPIRWTFDVELTLKGQTPDPQDVWSARDGAACGYQFEEGRRYLVFAAEQKDGTLGTNMCSGNWAVP